ncbi:MAG TPA: UTP--glucose-1-phosphate uridylyltransferase GalU [Gammaproteobacteria bacterium]|nr:UTP--glucose-1-phosphate uridylyltransferase GalU [Gammaproteobacteria bacterium]
MTAKVRKAVFPAAGLGTRFLPATKASPKEMLPIVDKPLIQYAAEEAVAAGITDLIFIIGRTKRAIADHFDKAYELEVELEKYKKSRMLELVRNILPPNVNCIYIRQADPMGLGHAVLCARAAVGNEPFAVLLADDLIDGAGRGCLAQMVKVYEEREASVLAIETVPPEETQRYGIVEAGLVAPRLSRIKSIVEKPSPDKAPSNRAVVGRYILTPAIFDLLENVGRGAGGEIQLTDGIARLLGQEPVYAYEFEGKRYDCGSKIGYLQATVEYAMKHPELNKDFSTYLQQIKPG